MEHLEAFIGDCDRRTEAAKQRLAETQEELSAEVAVKANSVHELAEQIGQKLAKAEQLGEEGFVEESMKLMEEVRNYELFIHSLHKVYKSSSLPQTLLLLLNKFSSATEGPRLPAVNYIVPPRFRSLALKAQNNTGNLFII